MIADLRTMMWKEWNELLLQQGGVRSGLLPMLILPLGIMGVFLPWQMGRAWVESPLTPALWAWLPLMLTASLVADSFAGERERHTLETLLASRLPDRAILFGKMCAVVGYGWGLTLLSVLIGLVTVNLIYGRGELLLYSPPLTATIIALSLLGAWLSASAGVLVSLRAATVRQAQQVLMITIMLLLFGPVYGLQALPDAWRARLAGWLTAGGPAKPVIVVMALLTVIDLTLTVLAAARFQRARLTLS
ncbi:MAG TPA: ABC transporter permease [Blastocatellia bacterium]|nr:ABC transporter permease [Blastocatellia bacterium]